MGSDTASSEVSESKAGKHSEPAESARPVVPAGLCFPLASARPAERAGTSLYDRPAGSATVYSNKKRKSLDDFEQELLHQLEWKMSENEAFGFSIGKPLDRWQPPKAMRCKAKILEVLAEFEES